MQQTGVDGFDNSLKSGIFKVEYPTQGAPMDRSVARLNIEHFRRLLAKETDEQRRLMLQRLLAEEEAKLANSAPKEKKRRAR
ncbi:MAG TPA: hypothetical protein VMT22_04140 [Terriglobales bacterium]|nr:hypothetical protein [Terriglobales bacterium]